MKNLKITFAFLLFALSYTTHAQWVWNGTSDGNWHNPANWNLNMVPTNGASVLISTHFNYPNIEASTANINRLDILLGSNLFIGENGTLNVNSNDVNSPPGAIQINDARLYNKGTINVNVTGNAQNGIYVTGLNGQVSNAATSSGISATMNINNSSGRGINIEGSAKFHNTGSTLNIGTTTVGGVGIKVSSGTFTNSPNANNNAILNISNTTGNAIAVSDKFYNQGGEINLGINGAIGQRGLKTNPGGIFTNEGNTGIVNIDHTNNNAIYNNSTIENEGTISIGTNSSIAENGIYNDGEFINNGVIEIDGMSDPSKFAIYNSNSGVASFLNGSCQNTIHIHSNNIIFDEQNTFTNNGLIIENSSRTSDIQTNNGTIANLNGGTFNIANNNGKTVANIGDRLWMGCSNTAWSNVDNWYPNGVPLTSDVVYFVGGTQPTIGSGIAAYAKELHISNGTTLTNSGYYVGFSDVVIDNGGTMTGNGNYYLGENWINNGTFIPGTSTVTFNGPVDAEISGTSTNTFNDLIIEKFTEDASVSVEDDFTVNGDVLVSTGELNVLAGKTISGDLIEIESSGTLTNNGTISGDLIEVNNNGALTNNGTSNISNINLYGTLTNNGNLKVIDFFNVDYNGTLQGDGEYQIEDDFVFSDNSTFIPGTSKVILNGSNSLTEISTIAPIYFYDLEINKSSGSAKVFGHFIVINKVTIQEGTLLVQQGSRLDPKDLIIEPNGIFNLEGSSRITGNWTNNGTFIPNNSSIFFGGDAQQLVGGTNTTTFAIVNFYKTNNDVVLNTNCEISTKLKMSTGKLDLNGNILTMGGIIEDESAASYIYGDGHISCTNDLNAPSQENMGNLGVEITSLANLASTTIKRYHQAQMINGETSIQRYYDISPTNNNGLDATVKFYYLDHELNGLAESELTPFRFNGSAWEGYAATDNDESLNYIETNDINTFSIWSLTTSTVLPVELIDFRANKTDRDWVSLVWQTASELNNEGFEIQYSINGKDWVVLGFVRGQGTSSLWNEYNYLHEQPRAGTNYYRLKQLDYDGQFEYSNIEVVNFTSLFDLLIYPNPVSDVLKLEIQKTYEQGNYVLFNSSGKAVKSGHLKEAQLLKIQVVDLPKGNYLLQIDLDGNRKVENIILQ